MYIDQTLQTYLDDLASAQSTPGGGSASAVTAAMGAALASMVCRLTLGKEKYAAVQEEISALLEQAEAQRERFQALVAEDIAAYGRLSECFKMPRETASERQARTVAIQEQLLEAALVPLEVAERARDVVRLCARIAEIGNANVISDIATGSMLAASAGAGAGWMVRINLQSLRDVEMVTVLGDRLSAALDEIALQSQQVSITVGERA